MSINIGSTDCRYCGDVVKLIDGEVFYIHKTNINDYIFRDAECPSCLALYVAWISIENHDRNFICDLSFRHSFNDEPDERDLPRYEVETQRVRTGIWQGDRGLKAYLKLGIVK